MDAMLEIYLHYEQITESQRESVLLGKLIGALLSARVDGNRLHFSLGSPRSRDKPFTDVIRSNYADAYHTWRLHL